MHAYGSFALLISSFLAATILPFSSEAALVGAVKFGMSADKALLYASIGNCLAVLLNYFLGYFLYRSMHARIHNSSIGKKVYKISHKYGYYALILSPLPIVGDPVTIASGLIRLNLFYFILITFALRAGRYYLILHYI